MEAWRQAAGVGLADDISTTHNYTQKAAFTLGEATRSSSLDATRLSSYSFITSETAPPTRDQVLKYMSIWGMFLIPASRASF